MKKKMSDFGFHPENFKFLYIGLAINVIGFLLMIGGGSENLNEFKEDELFSSTRITLAPILIVAGYIVIIYAIMKKGGQPNQPEEKK
jgi:hypothetical protein